MPEKLACRQVFGDCPAVHGNKRSILPLALVMNQTGNVFFTGTAFPCYQDRHHGRGNQPDIFIQLVRIPARSLDISQTFSLLCMLLFCRQVFMFDSLLDFLQNLVRNHRFGDIIESPQLHGLHRRGNVRITGHQNDLHARQHLFCLPQHLQPVLIRQPQIGQHNIIAAFLHLPHRLLARKCLLHLKTTLRQPRLQHQAKSRVIIYQQYLSRHHNFPFRITIPPLLNYGEVTKYCRHIDRKTLKNCLK